MVKKIITLLLCFLLLSCFVLAEEYEDDEISEYEENVQEVVEEKSDYELCVYDKDKDACSRITQNKRDSIDEIEQQIKEAEGDREKAASLAMEYAGKAEALQAEIDDLKVQIEELNKRIEELEISIETNEKEVEKLNNRVKNRMVEAQKTMHFNGYLEFILKSKSFTDMLRRIYGVEAILSKDKKDKEELTDIITQLNKDKEELSISKQELDIAYEDIVYKQAELIALQEYYEEEEARINEELDRMTEERDNIYESFEDLQRMLREVNIIVNTGFVPAVHNSWISATVWNYSPNFLDGKWHLGVDYAASRGTEIHAPAGGVIIRANSDCADPGYLGSWCGNWISGGGNQVYMMAEVNGKVYGFIFFHMHDIYVSYGDYVLQDEVIGTVGSSGSSTGPHCHIEMYYLGEGELLEFLDMGWNATFSVGRGATAYNNRCYYDDGSYRQGSPCILNPEWYLPAN